MVNYYSVKSFFIKFLLHLRNADILCQHIYWDIAAQNYRVVERLEVFELRSIAQAVGVSGTDAVINGIAWDAESHRLFMSLRPKFRFPARPACRDTPRSG